jgi:hypothetical protein
MLFGGIVIGRLPQHPQTERVLWAIIQGAVRSNFTLRNEKGHAIYMSVKLLFCFAYGYLSSPLHVSLRLFVLPRWPQCL